jgi:TRAP-type C4-dicarboxylate transport system permease small subunit
MRSYKKILMFLEELVPAALFAIIVAAVLLGVITRYVFNAPLLWTGQLGLLSFVWMFSLSASGAWRKNMHIGVDLLSSFLPARAQLVQKLVIQLVASVILVICIYFAVILTQETTKVLQTLNTHYVWVYSAIPVGFSLMLLHTVEEIVRQIRGLFGPKPAPLKKPVSKGSA